MSYVISGIHDSRVLPDPVRDDQRQVALSVGDFGKARDWTCRVPAQWLRKSGDCWSLSIPEDVNELEYPVDGSRPVESLMSRLRSQDEPYAGARIVRMRLPEDTVRRVDRIGREHFVLGLDGYPMHLAALSDFVERTDVVGPAGMCLYVVNDDYACDCVLGSEGQSGHRTDVVKLGMRLSELASSVGLLSETKASRLAVRGDKDGARRLAIMPPTVTVGASLPISPQVEMHADGDDVVAHVEWPNVKNRGYSPLAVRVPADMVSTDGTRIVGRGDELIEMVRDMELSQARSSRSVREFRLEGSLSDLMDRLHRIVDERIDSGIGVDGVPGLKDYVRRMGWADVEDSVSLPLSPSLPPTALPGGMSRVWVEWPNRNGRGYNPLVGEVPSDWVTDGGRHLELPMSQQICLELDVAEAMRRRGPDAKRPNAFTCKGSGREILSRLKSICAARVDQDIPLSSTPGLEELALSRGWPVNEAEGDAMPDASASLPTKPSRGDGVERMPSSRSHEADRVEPRRRVRRERRLSVCVVPESHMRAAPERPFEDGEMIELCLPLTNKTGGLERITTLASDDRVVYMLATIPRDWIGPGKKPGNVRLLVPEDVACVDLTGDIRHGGSRFTHVRMSIDDINVRVRTAMQAIYEEERAMRRRRRPLVGQPDVTDGLSL